jgi:hypothetical protein
LEEIIEEGIGKRPIPTLGGLLCKVASMLAVNEHKPDHLICSSASRFNELIEIVTEHTSPHDEEATSFRWLPTILRTFIFIYITIFNTNE